MYTIEIYNPKPNPKLLFWRMHGQKMYVHENIRHVQFMRQIMQVIFFAGGYVTKDPHVGCFTYGHHILRPSHTFLLLYESTMLFLPFPFRTHSHDELLQSVPPTPPPTPKQTSGLVSLGLHEGTQRMETATPLHFYKYTPTTPSSI